MGVLYGRYDLLDRLTAYKVRPAPQDPPGKFETGTGNFEGMCGILGALEYIEWVGETFGAEHAERYVADFVGWCKPGTSFARNHSGKIASLMLGCKHDPVRAGIGGFLPQKDTLFQTICNSR